MQPGFGAPRGFVVGCATYGLDKQAANFTRIANYPRISIDVGKASLSSSTEVTLGDFPGTYPLSPISAEEQVAITSLRSALEDPQDALVAMVLDATRLEKASPIIFRWRGMQPLLASRLSPLSI